MCCKRSVKMILYLPSNMKNLDQYSYNASPAHHKYLLFHQLIPVTQKDSASFVGLISLLLTPHTMTWAFIRWVSSDTMSFTRILRNSRAITVILSSNRHLYYYYFCFISRLCRSWLLSYYILGLVLHNIWKSNG